MAGLIRIVAGALLIAHGLVHLLYLAPDVEEFSVERSWLLPAGIRHAVAAVLMATTVIAFALVGLAVWGVPGLSAVWPTLMIIASALSLGLLVVFWHNRLVFGVAIDLALIAVAVTQPTWMARIGG